MRALITKSDKEAPLKLITVDPPLPAANQAVVQVKAFTINRGEVSLIRSRTNGWRPGQDFAGIVETAAADGSGPSAGTRVAGFAEQGSWCEQFAVDTARLGILPDDVSFAEAATLPASAMTALRALRFGGLLIGRRVLVTGAAGTVGLFAVELAVRSGARVTALVNSDRAAAELDSLQPDSIAIQPGQLTGPYDLILDSVGGEVLERCLATVAPGGTIVPFGNVSGKPSTFNAFGFVGHEGARIQSFLSYAAGPIEQVGVDLTLLAALVDSGQLHPRIAEQVPWNAASRALQKVEAGGFIGKVVVETSSEETES